MRIVVLIQARTDSRRFPKKVLCKIKGKPLLWHVIDRIKHFECDDIVIATTKRKIDDEIVRIAKTSDVKFFRGKKDDVLDIKDIAIVGGVGANKVIKKSLGEFSQINNKRLIFPPQNQLFFV